MVARRAGYIAIAVIVIMLELAFCTGWLIIASENIVVIAAGGVDRHVVIAALFPLLICLANVRWLAQLWSLSVFGFVVYFVGVMGVSMWAMATGRVHSKTSPSPVSYDHSLGALAQFFGSALYAMEAILLALPVQNSMRRPGDASCIIAFGSGAYACLACAFATACSLFGLGGCGTVTDCLADGFIANTVRAALSAAMVLGYPCIPYPVTEIVEEVLVVIACSRSVSCPALLRFIIRLSEVALTCIVAAVISNFHVYDDAVGALLIPLAGFVVPPILHMRLLGITRSKVVVLSLDMLMVVLGLLLFTLGVRNTFF